MMKPLHNLTDLKWIFEQMICFLYLHSIVGCVGEIRHSDALFQFIRVPSGNLQTG